MQETCDDCGFDSELYNRADTISSQRFIADVIEAAYRGMDHALLGQRPDATTWSIAEYVDHVREMCFGNRFAIEIALKDPGTNLGESPQTAIAEEPASIDVDAAIARVDEEFVAMHELLDGLSEQQWGASVTFDGHEHSVDWFGRHVLHDALHHMADIGRIRHGFGAGAPTQTGTVSHLAVSDGGVPKSSVQSARVGPAGLDGDAQADRRHHGRPIQAVCLWGGDVIATLRAQGHPIAAGNAGENVTIDGVDWATLHPGSRIEVGSIPMLVTAHAIPCAKNAQWFADRDFNRILHSTNPGTSRLYAIPLAAGEVAVGDAVRIEP